jgi:hypothetical protein
VASALVAVTAHATPSTRLTYERGAGAERCPDEGVLRKAVEQRLGYDPFFPWADRTIVVRVATDARGVRAVIEMLDKSGILSGARELTAPAAECGELVSGMALAISIAIDPSSVDRAPKPDTASAEDPAVVEWSTARTNETPPPADTPASPPPRAPTNRAGERWIPDVGAGGVASTGITPAIAVGPTLGVALHRGPWELALEGRYQFAFDARVGAALVWSSLLEGALLGCWQPGAPFLCAEAAVGRFAISGRDVAVPRSDAKATAALGARAGVELPISAPWFIRIYADLQVRVARPVVDVDSRDVWTASAAGGFLGVALHRRFP